MSTKIPPREPLIINGVDFTDPLTPAEVAAMFRVQVKTVTQWGADGKLDSIRTLGGHRRYSGAQVKQMLRGETYPAPGSEIPDQPGYVVGTCGHRVAGSEWRAGYRTCEHCPGETYTPNGGQR